jgi:hypothetical protein
MRSKSLSSILSRSDGHDALLELLELDDDVKELKASIVKICNRIAADPFDETVREDLLGMVRRPIAIMHKLDATYNALGDCRR